MRLLFFSRGRGRGHAIPDMSVADELARAMPDITIQFVSYGTGARTLTEHGREVIDLGLPDDNPALETLIRINEVISRFAPNLIIAHEEFVAAPCGRMAKVPVVVLTDWFPPRLSFGLDALLCADEVVFMDDPGYYDEPECLRGKVIYTGPFVRDIAVSSADRESARKSIGLMPDSKLVIVLPGGATQSSEERAPIAGLVSTALSQVSPVPAVLWIANPVDVNLIRSRIRPDTNIQVIEATPSVASYMNIADLAITKGTRKTSFELCALDVPSISISYGTNPVDDNRIAHIRTNTALRARGLPPEVLCQHIVRLLQRGTERNHTLGRCDQGRQNVHNRLVEHIMHVLVTHNL